MKDLNLISLYLFCLLLASCSTIETKKFDEFESSIKKLNSSLEVTLLDVQKKYRDHGIQKFASSPVSKASDIIISLSGYNWSMPKPPLYFTLIKTDQQLIQMNNVFEEYVGLLVQLSSASLSKEEFIETAKDLNKSSSELAKTAGFEGPKQNFSILSSATVGLLQNFIDNKKAKYLDEAIKKNQPSIEEYSELQTQLVQIILKSIKQTYDEKYFELGKQWVKSPNKIQVSTQMFDLNDSFVSNLDFYKGLEDAYRALPMAHKRLISNKPSTGFKNKIGSLIKSSKRIIDTQKVISKEEVEK